jgi:D-beta-D-heptose 7-phosphate kinase/D-beta-D-heptose 1-phosphate adenosyltransferase
MKDILERIKSLRLLVVGDVMLDRYVFGEVNRISPEAPVPVLTVEGERAVAGGAANVALNAADLGAQVEAVGWFGLDDQGAQLRSLLGDKGIEVDPTLRFQGAPTISKTRVMASNQQICRVDREEGIQAYHPNLTQLGEALRSKAEKADAVILSDYGKGFVTNELISIVREASPFLAVDPKPSRLLDYSKPDLLTPNRHEALEMAGRSRLSRESLPQEEIVRTIFERFEPGLLTITLGADGMLLAKKGKVEKIMPTAAREVFDVSGAGDTVISSLTLALVAGANFEQAAELANVAAGIVVAKVGTATASPQEILSHL